MSKHARLGMAVLLLVAATAQAHKITGTDIATLTQLQVDHNGVAGTYELQYGELAGLDERQRMDTDSDGRIATAELETYIAQQRERLGANLSMEADGQPLPVRLEQGEVLPDEPLVAPAQMTLRYQLVAQAPEFTQRHTLIVRDANQFPRLVHADISLEGMPLVDIDQAVPRQGALKQVRIQAPEAPVEAAIALKPSELLWQSGAFASSQAMLGNTQTTTGQQISSSTDRLKEMLRSDKLSFGLIVFALVLSIFLGAVHALEPGHGKTIVAAYLIGSRGTVANAIFLGGVVTFTHTFSVILLGVITLFASRYILPEQIFPWLGAGSGLLIVGLGIWLFVRNLTGRGHGHSHGPFGHQHTHLPEGHAHDRGEDRDHDHEHELAHNHPHPHDHDHGDDHDHAHPHDHPHEHDHEHELAPGHPHPHDHGDNHDHGDEHDHPHDHPHEHEHEHEPHRPRNYVHAHDHDRDSPHRHPHEHEHSHEHDPAHDHEHELAPGHSHPHDHPHNHDHEHDSAHDHPHDHEHSHEHDHEHDGGHEHEHLHDHPHDHEHELASGHSHPHDHPHDHEHGDDHDHPHDHDHSHGRDSGHSHPHSHEHDLDDGHEHEHPHEHPHDREDDHALAHVHDHDHGHSHLPQGKVTMGSLLALGISGGIVPCPGALVILLLAVALHRIAFGLTLIIAFSLGLAAVLIAIGILMVKARPLMDRFSGEGRLVRALPIVSSILIIGVGLAMAVRSLMEAGILIVNL